MSSLTISHPILYLDFDGVLHPDAAYRTREGIVLKNYPGHTLFENAELLSSMLELAPSVRVILSTSWVQAISFNKARSRLPQQLAARVIGATWHRHMDQRHWSFLTRYQQVQQHATRHEVSNWIALDDDFADWPEKAQHRLVACDTRIGFTGAVEMAKLKNWLTRTSQG